MPTRTALLVLLAFARTASGQSASHLSAARHLVELTFPPAFIQASESSYVATKIRAYPALRDYKNELADWVHHIHSMDIIGPRFAQRLAADLSEPQIDSIIAFYESPIGRRWALERTAISGYLVQLEVELSTEYWPEFVRRIRERAAQLHRPDPTRSN